MNKHAKHICWSCGGTITPDQDEQPVLGLKPPDIRYSHADENDCRESMRRAGTLKPPAAADPIAYLDDRRDEEGPYYES